MKNKIIALFLLFTLTLSACGAQQNSQELPGQNISAGVSNEDSSASESEVILNIPANSIDIAKNLKIEYESITINADGSATYVMTNSQHEKLLNNRREQIINALNKLVGSVSYPNFTNIKANDNFSEFTVTTSSKELDTSEALSTILFYHVSDLYAMFSGETVENISVTFINSTSGDIITTANSSDSQQPFLQDTAP